MKQRAAFRDMDDYDKATIEITFSEGTVAYTQTSDEFAEAIAVIVERRIGRQMNMRT